MLLLAKQYVLRPTKHVRPNQCVGHSRLYLSRQWFFVVVIVERMHKHIHFGCGQAFFPNTDTTIHTYINTNMVVVKECKEQRLCIERIGFQNVLHIVSAHHYVVI